jgi:hypothetical protein
MLGQRGTPLRVRFTEGLGVNAHKLAAGVRIGHLMALSFQVFDVQLNGFLNERGNFFASFASRNTTWKIWDIGTKAAGALLNDYKVLHVRPHFFRPACFRMLFNVPGGTSTLGLPATVTVPPLEA